MDYSEFRKQYNVLMDKHHDIGNQIIRLKKKYIDSLPIKEEDTITIREKQYRVKLIRVLPNSAKLELIVQPLKKDGTTSTKCEYIWLNIDEVINYAKNKRG